MKKSNMLIAVFAVVVAAASVAKAEDVNIDFDGRKSAPTFAQLLAQAPEAVPQAVAEIKPEPVKSEDFFNPRMMSVLDASIKSAIDYSEAKGNAELKAAFEKFLVKATPQQKYEFVYGGYKVYRMPSFSQEKGVAQWICTAITQTVCNTVCDPGCVQECKDTIVNACKWM
ncbi:MAG: hypothetical protein Q8O90_07895 [Elusimicrobiota bacterium]|nr:hypothetical protein [Elusimicrobiota bacterium]